MHAASRQKSLHTENWTTQRARHENRQTDGQTEPIKEEAAMQILINAIFHPFSYDSGQRWRVVGVFDLCNNVLEAVPLVSLCSTCQREKV